MAWDLEKQATALTNELEELKKKQALVKDGKFSIPSEPSKYAEWYEANKSVLEELSKSIKKVTQEWATFVGQNAANFEKIQAAEKTYDTQSPENKAVIDMYRKAKAAAEKLEMIVGKIQPSNYDDSKIMRSISGTKTGLSDRKFFDDSTISEGGLSSMKRLGKIATDSIGQEYFVVNYGGDKVGVLRVPKEDGAVVQVAWIDDAAMRKEIERGRFKGIRESVTKLNFANSELDGSKIIFNPLTLLSSIGSHGKDSIESIIASGGILALEQALVAAITRVGPRIPSKQWMKTVASAVHTGLDSVGVGAKGLKGSALTVLVGTAIAGIAATLATDRSLTRTDLREAGFFQNGPTETTDDSSSADKPTAPIEINL